MISTPAIRTAVQGKQFIAKFYKLPSPDNVPLSCSNSAQRNSPELKTYEATRVAIPASKFTLPADLAQVSTETEVWVDQRDRKELDDFSQLLGTPGKN
jgi:hypothetical protein